MRNRLIFISVMLFLFLIGVFGTQMIAFHNRDVSLRNVVAAQQVQNTVVFDRVWKTIAQQADITSEYKDSFKEVYTDIMSNSAGGNKTLLAFIQSVNPSFDSSLYEVLMVTIEANRRDFEREQSNLIEKNKTHTLFLQTFPNNVLASIMGRDPIDIQIVTSAKTAENFSTGQENDIELFRND